MTTQDTQAATTEKLVGFSGVARVSDEPHGRPEEPSADGVSHEEIMKLQLCWNSTMCKVMKIPEGYQDVTVLIIKWNEKLDELNTKDEVRFQLVIF